MKNLEQLMASFLCRKDFLDPEGTKSGGVPHIQLSESIKIRMFDDLYQLDAFYLAANNRVHLLMTNPQGEVVNVTFSTFMNIFLIQRKVQKNTYISFKSNNLEENGNTERLQEN